MKHMLDRLHGDTAGSISYLTHTNSRISMSYLGGVCTGRFLQGFGGTNPKPIQEGLEELIEFLRYEDGNGAYHVLLGSESQGLRDINCIVYKVQTLVAVTNGMQVAGIEALKRVGFVPSQPAKNNKYGKGRELITWTFAVNGWEGEEDANK